LVELLLIIVPDDVALGERERRTKAHQLLVALGEIHFDHLVRRRLDQTDAVLTGRAARARAIITGLDADGPLERGPFTEGVGALIGDREAHRGALAAVREVRAERSTRSANAVEVTTLEL